MPLLGGLLITLFGSFAAWLSKFVTKKFALAGAAIGTFAALSAILYGVVAAIIAAVNVSFPIATTSAMCSLFYAINTDAAMVMFAVTVAGDTAVALYAWNAENLRLAAYVT